MTRFDRLWQSTGGPGAPPRADSGNVKARVNAVLDAGHTERKLYMRKKFYTALAAAAVVLAVTGTALASVEHWDALSAWFRGDKGQEYLDSELYSVSDGNYTLTVESSAADENSVYLTVSVTALNDEANAFLHSDGYLSINTWDAWSPEERDGEEGGIFGWASRELESEEENCRRFALDVHTWTAVDRLCIRSGYMEEGRQVEVPVAPAPSVTVRLNASGTGVLQLHPASALESDRLTIKEVTLTPFTCRMTLERNEVDIHPRIFLRLKDGSIRTQSQLMTPTSGSQNTENYRFYEVQDLDQIASVIAFDREYPLDGSPSAPVEHDPSLDPFTISVIEQRLDGDSSYPISARELTEKLGGTFRQDPDSGEASCTYRGVEIVLRPGSAAALVDGRTVELMGTPAILDGVLAAPARIFCTAWGIECTGLRDYVRSGDGTETTVWLDNYIVP